MNVMNLVYIEATAKALREAADRLDAVARNTAAPQAENEAALDEVQRNVRQSLRFLFHVFENPPEPGSWRKAIGCAPRRPGEVSAEDAIRRGRE